MNGLYVTLHILAVNSSSDVPPLVQSPWQTSKQRHSCVGTLPQCKAMWELLQPQIAAQTLTEACRGILVSDTIHGS